MKVDAQWVIISLFGRNYQYVIAEATPTFGLWNEGDAHDRLWHGVCTVPYERSFCQYVLETPVNAQRLEDSVFVSTDLAQDDRFKNLQGVLGVPHARSLVCTPIVSPKGLTIGSYTIIDDKPRPPVNESLVKFLKNMSQTVMNHLISSRTKFQHLRAERMIVGIGSFLEGKGSLRSSWVEATTEQEKTEGDDEEGCEGQINQTQQARQITNDTARAMRGGTSPSNSRLASPRDRSPRLGIKSAGQSRLRQGQLASAKDGRTGPTKSQPGNKVKSENLSGHISEAFSRAANIARESLEIEGLVYFDANFRSRAGLVDYQHSDSDDSNSSQSHDEKKVSKFSRCKEPHLHESKVQSDPCLMLGFSTTNSSSINHEFEDGRMNKVPESLLKRLLRHYPQGKIFNFSAEGSVSEDESTDSKFKGFFQKTSGAQYRSQNPARKYKKTRPLVLREDAAALLLLAPHSRSIIFAPLWDPHKKRWYSGCIAWTRTPHRVFTSDDEQSFLFALGNSLMADVHRLNAEFSGRAASDLLSSLSHELRSPLHGIFGTAELLRDRVSAPSQLEMIHTIESCTNTLLDTIDHLLEYASINKHSKSTNYLLKQETLSDSRSSVMLDEILEEVVESVFAGFTFLEFGSVLQKAATPGGIAPRRQEQPVSFLNRTKVILDIQHGVNWHFLTQPGRWRLILMDLFGNALKFTRSGLILITAIASPVTIQPDSSEKATESKVTVTVKDTGPGIDPEYLQYDLFEAFSQEDVLSSGNGLGLHVTQRTVSALGGDIQVFSQRGLGTEIVTNVTLQHSPNFAPPDALDANSVIKTARELSSGKSIGMIVSSRSDTDGALLLALERLYRDWFGMTVREIDLSGGIVDQCDFYIVTRDDLDLEVLQSTNATKCLASPVIILCSSPQTTNTLWWNTQEKELTSVVEFISQPCGPRKMAKTLHSCIQRQHTRGDSANIRNTTQPAYSSNVRPIFKQAEQGVADECDNSFPIQYEANTRKYLAPSIPQIQEQSPDEHINGQRRNSDRTVRVPDSPASTVLIVDDNDINVRILVACVKKLGYNHIIAQNGLEAFEAFKENPAQFSLVLMGQYTLSPPPLYSEASAYQGSCRYLHACYGRPRFNTSHPRS